MLSSLEEREGRGLPFLAWACVVSPAGFCSPTLGLARPPTLPRPGFNSVAFVPSLGPLGWNLCPPCSQTLPGTGILPCIHPMIRSGEEVWLRLALLSPPPWPLCCPALPGKQEEADRFPLPAGPLYTEQNLGGVQGADHGSLARRHFCHERNRPVVFLKAVPSGKGAAVRITTVAMTVESREGAWGSLGYLLPAALAALMVSFVEPSHSAAITLVRNWLCPSLCPPVPGDWGCVAVLAELEP